MIDKPRITVLALGGTIAMVAGDEGGVRPGLTAEDGPDIKCTVTEILHLEHRKSDLQFHKTQ